MQSRDDYTREVVFQQHHLGRSVAFSFVDENANCQTTLGALDTTPVEALARSERASWYSCLLMSVL